MVRILIKQDNNTLQLIERPSPYSITNETKTIKLSEGWNEIPDLKYGFYINFLISDNLIIENIDLRDYDTSNVVYMNLMFANISVSELNLRNFNTSNTIHMSCMFANCDKLVELDLSSFDTSKVEYVNYMLARCRSLVRLDLSNFDASNFKSYAHIFYLSTNINYIKCRKEFKEWCLKHQDEIDLPESMREGGSGVWDVIN